MSDIGEELSDIWKVLHFALLDYCVVYWHFRFHENYYDSYGIISLPATYILTKVLHSFKHSYYNFHSTTLPQFENIKESVEALIYFFTFHFKTEEALMNFWEKTFMIFNQDNLKLSAKKILF